MFASNGPKIEDLFCNKYFEYSKTKWRMRLETNECLWHFEKNRNWRNIGTAALRGLNLIEFWRKVLKYLLRKDVIGIKINIINREHSSNFQFRQIKFNRIFS